MIPGRRPTRTPSSLVVLAAGVVTWRVLALSGISAGAEPDANDTHLAIRALLAVMGLTFVGLGLFAFLRVGSRTALIFAFYGVFGGLHWGGPLPLPPGEAQLTLMLLYLVLSSLLTECLFLHFALSFPERWPVLAPRGALGFLYLPAHAGALLGLGVVLVPDSSPTHEVLTSAFKALYAVATNAYALLSIIVIMVRLVRADREQRRSAGLVVLAVAIVLPALIYLPTLAAGVHNDLVNLCMVLTPLGATYALTRSALD